MVVIVWRYYLKQETTKAPHMTLNSLRWKITGLVLLVVLSFNFLMQLAIWLIETSYSDIGNRPVKDWFDKRVIQQAEHFVAEERLNELNAFLASYCSNKRHAINHTGQHYAEVTVNHLYLVDGEGNYQWSCSGVLPDNNAFLHLPVASRDDVADAIVGRFNSGVEALGNNNYMVVKGINGADGAIYRVLISEQTWSLSDDFNPAFYYPVEVLSRGLSWSAASLVIGFIPAFILAFLIASRISKKVREITSVIGRWASGDFAARFNVNSSDDTGRALVQLNQMAEKIRLLVEQKQLVAEKNERQRIAAELHDTVKQLLYANNLQLAGVKATLGPNNEKALTVLQEAIATNKAAFANINTLIETLTPIEWEHTSLAGALRQELTRWGSEKGIALELDIQENIGLSADQSYVFYRCIHEALQNVHKHSGASKVWVKASQHNQQLVCSIKDNGTGFQGSHTAGQGLALMRARLEAMKGSLAITSDNGCTLTITMENEQ